MELGLSIGIPIAYVAIWLACARLGYLMTDERREPEFEGVMSMLATFAWPVVVPLVLAWAFVTRPTKAERKRERDIATARLEREIYGRTLP